MTDTPGLWGCAFQTWSPGIGDPTIWGWLTVALYALAALVAALTARAGPFPAHTRLREQVFWTCLALAMAALAVNKQLDLQSLMTALARCAAQAQGWYEDRRIVQLLFILGLMLFAVVFGIYILIQLWGTMKRSFLPLAGLIFVGAFVLIRAAGFHHMDQLIGVRLPAAAGSVPVNFLLEAPGPLLILLSGLWLLRSGPPPYQRHIPD